MGRHFAILALPKSHQGAGETTGPLALAADALASSWDLGVGGWEQQLILQQQQLIRQLAARSVAENSRGQNPMRSPANATTSEGRRRFPTVRVSASLELSLRRRAEQLVRQTVEWYHAHQNDIDHRRWQRVRCHGGLDAYLDRKSWAATSVPSLLAAGTIPGRLEDLLLGLYADDSESTRVLQHLLNRRCIDAEVLHTFERQPPGDARRSPQYMGIKWSLFHPPGGGTLTSNRDVCYVEKLGTLQLSAVSDAREVSKQATQTIAYYSLQSVDLPECQPRADSSVQRAQLAMCVLLEQVTPGTVRMYTRMKLESRLSPLLAKIAIRSTADIALSAAKALDVAMAKRCSTLLVGARHQDKLPLSRRCQVCDHWSSLLDRLKSCAGCSRSSLCRSCRVECPSFRRALASKATRVLSAELCHGCVDSITTAPAEREIIRRGATQVKSSRNRRSRRIDNDLDEETKHDDSDGFTASSDSSSFLLDLYYPPVPNRHLVVDPSSLATAPRPVPSPSAVHRESPQTSVTMMPFPSSPPALPSPSPSEARTALLHRLVEVSATAEATFLLAKEQSEVARVFWERNLVRDDRVGSIM